ncbi:MAG: carboxypeptidase-like regulatory domain-containing protein, partial [bacterium]|nr:carboxypeptidase-like regulatory domain-containing protein [bacterium]
KSSRNPQKALNLATIAEGERRFFDIKLRKGCLIKGTVYIKDQTGVRPLIPTDEFYPDNVRIYLFRIVTPEEKDVYPFGEVEYDEVYLDKKGNYYINGVMPFHSYLISYLHQGFAIRYKSPEVKNLENLTINHTFDDTDKTGISVKIYTNNEPIHGSINMIKSLDGRGLGPLVLSDGRYILKNITPGNYQLLVSFYSNDDYIGKQMQVKIENGFTKYLDLKY